MNTLDLGNRLQTGQDIGLRPWFDRQQDSGANGSTRKDCRKNRMRRLSPFVARKPLSETTRHGKHVNNAWNNYRCSFHFEAKMDIWETDKLLLFIGFVIPGFVSLKIYELLQHSAPKESANQLIDAIAYSCINYALLFFPIYMVEKSQIRSTDPIKYILFYTFVLLITPTIWPFILNSPVLQAKSFHVCEGRKVISAWPRVLPLLSLKA